MNLGKFTEKAQEAVLESQNLAQALGHQTIKLEHLLLSLIRQADGIVPQVLQKLTQTPINWRRFWSVISTPDRVCPAPTCR